MGIFLDIGCFWLLVVNRLKRSEPFLAFNKLSGSTLQ